MALLEALPEPRIAAHREVLGLVAERQLSGRGLGWIDVHLLASALLSECSLWTLDIALNAAAVRTGVALE